MTYATQTDLVERFGSTELAQLTDPAAGVTIDAVAVARALGDAAAEVDSYLGKRYALPLASVPAVLVRVAADVARYYLWDNAAPETVRTRYAAAVALLKLLASGQTVLAGAAGLEPAAGAVAVAVRAPARQFSSGLLDQFAPRG